MSQLDTKQALFVKISQLDTKEALFVKLGKPRKLCGREFWQLNSSLQGSKITAYFYNREQALHTFNIVYLLDAVAIDKLAGSDEVVVVSLLLVLFEETSGGACCCSQA